MTSIFMLTATGSPARIPGRNFHCSSASIAFSSRPKPKLRRTRRIWIDPSLWMMASSLTTPSYRAFRASSEYSGWTRQMTTGSETPPPTWYMPPPKPPPSPSPRPVPPPSPIPVPCPVPMPPPVPGPADGGPGIPSGAPNIARSMILSGSVS